MIAYELYEELVFQDPVEPLYKLITAFSPIDTNATHSKDWEKEEQNQIAKIQKAKEAIQTQIGHLQQLYEDNDREIKMMTNELKNKKAIPSPGTSGGVTIETNPTTKPVS
eukprot:Awhi_evm1s746